MECNCNTTQTEAWQECCCFWKDLKKNGNFFLVKLPAPTQCFMLALDEVRCAPTCIPTLACSLVFYRWCVFHGLKRIRVFMKHSLPEQSVITKDHALEVCQYYTECDFPSHRARPSSCQSASESPTLRSHVADVWVHWREPVIIALPPLPAVHHGVSVTRDGLYMTTGNKKQLFTNRRGPHQSLI